MAAAPQDKVMEIYFIIVQSDFEEIKQTYSKHQ